MPGSMNSAIKRRQLRHIGNKATIPSGHPDGNKGGMTPGPFGRASMSQLASGGSGPGYQMGTPNPSHNIHVHVAMQPDPVGREIAPAVEARQNVDRLRTPAGPASAPPVWKKGTLARRQKGK